MSKVCPVCGTTYPDTNVFCQTDGSTLRAAESDGDLVGSVIADRYLITEVLGEGGMGKVYLARHVRLPSQAAIKVLRPEMLQDTAAVARFNREAANACRIEHDGVARVYDFGETPDGMVYLAMEYVAGTTLKGLIADAGPMPAERTARIVRQVADGLDAAHRLGIVHRDLKPDNILVMQDDRGQDKCKVVDFGIAKAIGDHGKEAGLTRTGFIVGTPEFMSPEQILGEAIDHRSDVYALALVAYQCLTGQLPFDSNTPDRGMTARLVADPRPLATAYPAGQWPAALQDVLVHGLHKDPAQRPASAGALADAFEAALRAETTPPASASSGTARGATAVASYDDRTSASRTAPREAAAATASAPASGRSGWMIPAAVVVLGAAGGAWWWLRPSSAVPTSAPAASGRSGEAAPAVTPSPATGPAGGASDAASAAVPQTNGSARPAASPSRPMPSVAPAAGRGSVAAAAPTSSSGATANASGSARATLDSLTKVLDPSTADENTAKQVLPALRSLLVRLPTADDSTWAYIRIAEAHVLTDNVPQACAALRAARGIGRTMAQAQAINRFSSQLSCP